MLKPIHYLEDFALRNDSVLADFGCGAGSLVKEFSELVPKGKVYALDIHRDMIEHLQEDVEREKAREEKARWQNVFPVWCDFEAPGGSTLKDASVDLVFLVNTFHLLRHKKSVLMEIRRVLKRGGKLFFVDWHTHIGESLLQKEFVLNHDETMNLFVELGMEVVELKYKDQNHFVLLSTK